jgi:hypothetical protein
MFYVGWPDLRLHIFGEPFHLTAYWAGGGPVPAVTLL